MRILPWAPRVLGPEQAAAGTVGRDARRAGLALRRAGVTVSLAPWPMSPASRGCSRSRSFSDGRGGRARPSPRPWRAGAREAIAPTAKHFPGLGAAKVNTDDDPVTIRRGRAKLMAVDMPPFAAAIPRACRS